MAVSSFDKVCKNITETTDFRDYVLRRSEAIDAAKVIGWKFFTSGDDYEGTKTPRGVELPNFQLQIDWGKSDDGDETHETVWSSSYQSFTMDVDNITDSSDLKNIVRKNFGVNRKCPTYNCNKDKVLEKFPGFARSVIFQTLSDKIVKAQERLRIDMIEVVNSESFKRERIRHHELHIINDINKVLKKYGKLATPQILREALDSYICHELMDS